MRSSLLAIGLFALTCLAPTASLVAGVVEPYGQGRHPAFPSAHDLARTRGSWDKLGEAILHRSLVTRSAVRIRNWVAYELLGYVDTDRMVSGKDDWLFLKDSLSQSCANTTGMARALAHLDATTDLAEAGQFDLTISVSPDKDSVYPDKLTILGKRYWQCEMRSRKAFRRALKAHAPRIVDPSDVFEAERSRHPDRSLYFTTDTHWTPYGGAVALRQLYAAVFKPTRKLPWPTPAMRRLEQRTDLAHGMLLLDFRESFAPLEPAFAKALAAANTDLQPRRTAILHDSFLARINDLVHQTFKNPHMLHLERDAKTVAKVLPRVQRLIVNSVERALVRRANRGVLARTSAFYRGVLRKNMETAAGCTDFVSVPLDAPEATAAARVEALYHVAVEAGALVPTGGDPRVRLRVPVPSTPGSLPCLRIEGASVSGLPAHLEIFLPNKRQEGPLFEAGRSVHLEIGKQATATLVLPAYVAGREIRVDPGDSPSVGIRLESLAFGGLAPELRDGPDAAM